jgi:ATP-dependent DNA helicase RecQ
VSELLNSDREIALNLYELSARHDIRPLVLRTALTYLELLGVLRQGTPIYAGYRLKEVLPLGQIIAKFEGDRARFITDIFSHAKKGKMWYSLYPIDLPEAIRQDRPRIVRALEYLAEQGWIELEASDVRHRYTVLRDASDTESLVAELVGRFTRREEQEIRRIQHVLRLVTHEGCQVNALVGYFGEKRTAPCGHCMHCATGKVLTLPPAGPRPGLPTSLDMAAFAALRREHPEALGESRQAARFLCGLSSPAASKARLGRDKLFGAFEDYRFGEVLAWCEEQAL